ncbi:uncharacterized protein Z518_04655 [Rhinocladiella mackenziei CBS 650.93]|uniref:Rhinocladiella mackenziei CBS 650.93 unplaced genomic scaffold supercont1.3, whole genome shotgun sequence n=1 Tax=Rhinocladiella mackenziei CBS 650.93 TaxID=1442369 RepID=A0A0D2ILP3_9EURO|nr:uncharacterized protein Z518_04655 [Rhinocladiella mackenziei CBS 650.93]KIX06679.1 hypothetical protein Z518_04655 [Rhinocladiella mackenziei CBS 650.93]
MTEYRSILDEAVQVRLTTSLHLRLGHLTGKLGNVAKSSRQDSRRTSYSFEPQVVGREVRGRRFRTGIGGVGNISSTNKLGERPEAEDMACLMCDIQAPGIVLVEGSAHTGRGVGSNTYQPTDAEIEEARMNNENMRRQSITSINQRRESPAASLPSNTWASRRTSVADSMKDFIMGRRTSKF